MADPGEVVWVGAAGSGGWREGRVVFRVGVFNGDQKMCVSCKDLSPLFSVQFCAQ